MRKILYTITILANSFAFAQVGVNTTTPAEELHVAGQVLQLYVLKV